MSRSGSLGASTWGLIGVGLCAGFLSGLFGIGGGILIVPGLVMVLHMDQRLAHGTSLGAAIPISLAGIAGFTLAGEIDWAAVLPITLGAVAGALIGTRALRVASTTALQFCFAGILLVAAIRLLIQVTEATGNVRLSVASVLGLVVLGIVSGVLAGLLGVGGGIIIVPVLVVLFGVPAAAAKGTSLAVILPTAIVGTSQNARHDNVDVRASALVGLSGVASAFAGSALSVRLGSDLSNDLFAALLVVIAVRMMLLAIRGRRRARGEVPTEP